MQYQNVPQTAAISGMNLPAINHPHLNNSLLPQASSSAAVAASANSNLFANFYSAAAATHHHGRTAIMNYT